MDLESFRQRMADAGIEGAVNELLETFLADVPGRIAAIEKAVESGSFEEIAAAAHALRSAAMVVHAEGLGRLLEDLERAGRAERADRGKPIAESIVAEADRVCAAIRRYLEQQGS